METIAIVIGAVVLLIVSVGLAWAPPDSLLAWPMFTTVSILIAWDKDGAPLDLRTIGMSPEDSGVTTAQLIGVSESDRLPDGFYGYLLSGEVVLRVRREVGGKLIAERYKATRSSLPEDLVSRLRPAPSR